MKRPLLIWLAIVFNLVVALAAFLHGRFATALYMTTLGAGAYVLTGIILAED